MAAHTFVTISDYLRDPGKYEPDAEYVDGEIEERPMGEYDHALWQQAIQLWFLQHAVAWDIRVLAELRVQVAATRYRVPDVVVFDRSRPIEQVLTHPPLAVFEVLSPEDTIRRMRIKLADYQQKAIPAIYLVDPETGVFERYREGQLIPASTFELEVAERSIRFPFTEIAQLVD